MYSWDLSLLFGIHSRDIVSFTQDIVLWKVNNINPLQTPTFPSNKFNSKKLHPQFFFSFNWWNIFSCPSYNFPSPIWFLLTEKHSKISKQLFILSTLFEKRTRTVSDSISSVYFNADLRHFWENRNRISWLVYLKCQLYK